MASEASDAARRPKLDDAALSDEVSEIDLDARDVDAINGDFNDAELQDWGFPHYVPERAGEEGGDSSAHLGQVPKYFSEQCELKTPRFPPFRSEMAADTFQDIIPGPVRPLPAKGAKAEEQAPFFPSSFDSQETVASLGAPGSWLEAPDAAADTIEDPVSPTWSGRLIRWGVQKMRGTPQTTKVVSLRGGD